MTTSSPKLLDGCFAKLHRAEESIGLLDFEIATFLRSELARFEIAKEFQNDGRTFAFIAKGELSVPSRFSVLAGEIVHQLRSSLDHLVCALVLKNGGTIRSSHQFPICSTALGFEKAIKGGALKGVSESARDLVMSVQPYKISTPDDTVLSVVRHFNNLDKHQLLLVTCTVAQMGQNMTIGGTGETAITGFGDPGPRKITKEGTTIFTIDLAAPNPHFEADGEFATGISFEKCGRVEFAPVVRILKGLYAGTTHTVNLFKNEI